MFEIFRKMTEDHSCIANKSGPNETTRKLKFVLYSYI